MSCTILRRTVQQSAIHLYEAHKVEFINPKASLSAFLSLSSMMFRFLLNRGAEANACWQAFLHFNVLSLLLWLRVVDWLCFILSMSEAACALSPSQSALLWGGGMVCRGSRGPSFPLCFSVLVFLTSSFLKKKKAPAQLHLLPPEHWHTPFHLSFPTQNSLTTRHLGAVRSRRSSTMQVPPSGVLWGE